MFEAVGAYTLFIFAACNIITIPMVWALYPESNQRTLEEMNLLFAADSPWNWEAEKNYAILKAENPGLVQAAQRGKSIGGASGTDAEDGYNRKPSLGPRNASLSTSAQRRASQGAHSDIVNGDSEKMASARYNN